MTLDAYNVILTSVPTDLTTTAAAKLLGVGTRSLVRWANDGEIPCWKTPGGQRRFRPEDIEAFRQPTNVEADASIVERAS